MSSSNYLASILNLEIELDKFLHQLSEVAVGESVAICIIFFVTITRILYKLFVNPKDNVQLILLLFAPLMGEIKFICCCHYCGNEEIYEFIII